MCYCASIGCLFSLRAVLFVWLLLIGDLGWCCWFGCDVGFMRFASAGCALVLCMRWIVCFCLVLSLFALYLVSYWFMSWVLWLI